MANLAENKVKALGADGSCRVPSDITKDASKAKAQPTRTL
jgi:hypothetical protein